MQDSTQARTLSMLLDKIKTLFPRIIAILRRPTMNDDGQLGRTRHLHLPNENALLNIARRMIVKIVEPNLPPRNHLRIARELLEFRKVRLSCQLGFMWMNTNGRVDGLVAFGDFDGAIERTGAVAGPDSEHVNHACLT